MSKKFAVFDIDGTLIRWQLYHSLTDHLARHGYIPDASYQSMKDARMAWKTRTEKDAFSKYEKEVIRQFDKALRQISPKELELVADEVLNEYKDQVYTYSRDLLQKLKQDGYFLLAISGSPIEVVSKIAAYYQFDDWLGTVHFSKDNHYTGAKRVVAYHKDKALSELIDKHKLDRKGSIGIGDTKSDIPLLEMVDRPIAFNPEAALYACALEKNWEIIVERKNVVYKIQ